MVARQKERKTISLEEKEQQLGLSASKLNTNVKHCQQLSVVQYVNEDHLFSIGILANISTRLIFFQ
jgi:hypothetical protein